MFSNQNKMKEVSNKKKMEKNTNMQKLNNTLLNNQWVNDKIKRETEDILK